MTPAQRFQYMNCYHFFCAPPPPYDHHYRHRFARIQFSAAPAPIICHVEHVPPFYNSKYDLSKWFQCVHAHKLVCFVTILLSHSLFRSVATFSDYLSTTQSSPLSQFFFVFFYSPTLATFLNSLIVTPPALLSFSPHLSPPLSFSFSRS